MRLKLAQLCDTDSGINWISKSINHGDWPFRFLIKLQYTEYWGDEEMVKSVGKYMVEIHAVSIVAAADKLNGACNSMGLTRAEFDEMPDEAKHEVLADYGISARLFSTSGNSKAKALEAAHQELAKIDMLFGFYMDRPCNAIGDTGWDWIKGDIGASMHR